MGTHYVCLIATEPCTARLALTRVWLHAHADEMTWSSEGGESGVQTEEGAMAAALTRAFRAIDEEVIGSVRSP